MSGEERDPLVRFKLHPGVGGVGSWQHGSLAELLRSIPYLFFSGMSLPDEDDLEVVDLVPPLSAVNSLLALGKVDAGMSGGTEWKPFQIDAVRYAALVDELLTDPNYRFELFDYADRDLTFAEWQKLCLAQLRSARSNSDGN